MNAPTPPHHICPNCYEDAKKSLLQGETLQLHAGMERKTCARCGLVLEYRRRDLPRAPIKPLRQPSL